MPEYLFYIFAVITLSSAIVIAFSSGSKTASAALIFLLTGVCGFISLLNNGVTAAVFILGIMLLLLIYSLGFKYTEKIFTAAENTNRLSILPVGIIAILTAVIAAVIGAAKWDKFEIDPGYDQPVLIFTKYLPVIVIIGLAISVLIAYIYSLITGKFNTK